MSFSDEENETTNEQFPVMDAVDSAILMHRDAHFGGNFNLMIEYYESEGKGVQPEFEISRIRQLHEVEKQLKQDLAPYLLSGPEAESIAQAKEAYQKLRQIYAKTSKSKAPGAQYPKLIADLILSEEIEPVEEMDAIVKEKGNIVPSLIDLLRSENFQDPLFPGYGLAPGLAAKCLGRIGDKRAIISLFESIGESDFTFEDMSIEALKIIGESAKQFLLKVLHGHPITYDNERAAMALLQFESDPEIAEVCLNILKELDLHTHISFATYLILAGEGLKDPQKRKEFIELSKAKTTPKALHSDFETIINHWKG